MRRETRRAVLDPLIRRVGSPTAQRLLHVGGAAVHDDPGPVLAALLGTNDGVRHVDDFEVRWSELWSRVEAGPGGRILPAYYDIERRSVQLLYELVRTLQPEVVVETGVANGVSTFFLTSALVDNGRGFLRSVDVRDDVAPFLSQAERGVWELVVLPPRRRRRALEAVLDELAIDVFLHDSHHSYAWQMLEYESVLARTRPGAIIASDDVDASYAFATFCERHDLHAEFLFEGRKFFGAATVT